MKRKQLTKNLSAGRGRTRPTHLTLGVTLVVILALALFSVPKCVASEAGKAGTDSKKREKQVRDTTKEAAPEKLKPAVGQERIEQKKTATSLEEANSPKAINPVGLREAHAPSAPANDDKGRQIKWQLFSSGTVIGGTSSKYQLGRAPGDRLDGTVGQVGVGSGSSESFGTSGGFWQEFGEGFLRGDVNGDGILDLGDVLYLISYLYKGGPAPDPLVVGDCDCDGIIDLGDLLFLISYLYKGGPPPDC